MINGRYPVAPEPFICPTCGQTADEQPGFGILPLPEAVGIGDEMIPVISFICLRCETFYIAPVGSIDVRKP